MKLYQDIKDLDLLITKLKEEIKYKNNKNLELQRINTLIDVRNNYYRVLSNNFYFSSLDTLILSNVIMYMRANRIKIWNHESIEFAFKQVLTDIKYGRDLKYAELESHIITGIELRGTKEDLLQEKPKDKIQSAILDILDKLKTDLVWNLRN